MRSRDLVMIVVSFLAMLAGSFLPGLAEPLAPFPRLCLIVLLYLGFLSVGTEALFIHTRLIPGTVSGLVLIRLFALPLLSFFLFKLLMPQFALGALLVGAASIGVVAPIFSIMVNADTALVLAGNLLSSLLLPLTLPMLLYIVDSFMTLSGFGPMNLPAHLSLSGMTLSLCVTIIVPFAGAFLTAKRPESPSISSSTSSPCLFPPSHCPHWLFLAITRACSTSLLRLSSRPLGPPASLGPL